MLQMVCSGDHLKESRRPKLKAYAVLYIEVGGGCLMNFIPLERTFWNHLSREAGNGLPFTCKQHKLNRLQLPYKYC